MIRRRGPAALLALLALSLWLACSPARGSAPAASPAPAGGAAPDSRAVESFYRGKTIRIIIGFTAGGGFDVLGRLVGRHLSKHVPGNPTVVVENMPGATGLVASNHLYNAAPKDGTVLGVFSEPNLQAQLLNAEGVQFDARNFNWLGSTQSQTQLCLARTDSGVTSWEALAR
jgi:tripartite-type tricarboxylate transporter receptor subunit TctC